MKRDDLSEEGSDAGFEGAEEQLSPLEALNAELARTFSAKTVNCMVDAIQEC
jgi:hypothetical protein